MGEALTLVADGLAFAYPGSNRHWLWNLTFGPGLTWVRGSNGSGKSTLLKVLAGGLAPNAGALRLGAVDGIVQPFEYKRKVFWCGPDSTPFGHLTGYEFMGFMRSLYPDFRIEALGPHLQSFGIEPFMKQRLHRLSTGTQRKIWVTAALLSRAPVVLLDEPFNGLDVASRAHLESVLLGAQRNGEGRICLIVSNEQLGMASSVVEVGAGRLS